MVLVAKPRLRYFPPQGERVRMIEAPDPMFAGWVGWEFLVLRHIDYGISVRLRARYEHTAAGWIVEVVMHGTDARYFEAA